MSEHFPKQRYRVAKAIASEALELEPARRQALIKARCGSDDALRQEVDWLIAAAEDDAEDEVPESFQAAARSALQDVSLEVPLPRNYRLLKRIGQGGMGIVYLAERVDGNLRQPVAFKLLHLSEADNDLVARRFSAERGILSRLNHPRIAHLIDGGVTAEGRPFMATEFVDGERIDRWAARGQAQADVIDLFIKVCEAVEYAHRHMVIHRDLKPANILVTDSGEPKLLDFGVARLLDADSQPGEGGGQALTLAYASPEQIRGEGLSAATDVYSLGVLLYELLAGVAPFEDDSDADAADALSRRILAGEYPPPAARDGQRLPADLIAIVGKAMQRDESLRYDSVSALAEDLRRFRERRPVTARAGGAFYRARRFASRHRAGLALGVIAGGIGFAFLIDREMQLDRIAWERDRAEAVTNFMSGLLSGADSLPARGNDVTVREILDLGARQLATPEHDNPAALAQMHVAVGEAYNALGLGEQALPLLEDAVQMLGERLPVEEQALLQAELGAAYDSAGRAAEAIVADQRSIELLEQAPGEHGAELLRLRIRKLRNQANVLDRPPESVVVELQGILDTLSATPDGDRELLFEAHSALVGAKVAAGQAQAALADAIRARDLAETLYRPGDPRRLRGRYVHATALMLIDPEAAVAMFENLIDDHERLVGPSQRLANTIGNLGVAQSRLGRTEESMASFARAAAMIEQAVGRDHYLYRLSMTNLAALRLRAGRPAEAEGLVREILPGLEQRHDRFGGIETFYWVSALEVLGGAQVMQQELAGAAQSYRQALQSLSGAADDAWPGLRERIVGKLAEVDRELSRS